MYRAQFAYPSNGKREAFHHAFDGTNTPGLAGSLAAGAITQSGIPLSLQADAPFVARGFKVASGQISDLLIQFKDCFGDYLSDSLVPMSLYASPSGVLPAGALVIPFEPELKCPSGGTFWAYLQNPTGDSIPFPAITLFGFKNWGAN